jgi:hypothetical protein
MINQTGSQTGKRNKFKNNPMTSPISPLFFMNSDPMNSDPAYFPVCAFEGTLLPITQK